MVGSHRPHDVTLVPNNDLNMVFLWFTHPVKPWIHVEFQFLSHSFKVEWRIQKREKKVDDTPLQWNYVKNVLCNSQHSCQECNPKWFVSSGGISSWLHKHNSFLCECVCCVNPGCVTTDQCEPIWYRLNPTGMPGHIPHSCIDWLIDWRVYESVQFHDSTD